MATLAHHLGLGSEDDWTFAVRRPARCRRLAEATGFWYDWDPTRQQFDHPAMLAGFRRAGWSACWLAARSPPARLDELVREVSGEFVPSYPLPGRMRFRCVQFDAATGRLMLDWGFVLLLLPVVSTSMVTVGLFMAGARRRRPRSVGEDPAVPSDNTSTSS